ncbi:MULTISPECIES: hypothetical protein [unclassified Microbacterium]|uniref:hypothetical protein n=1 Tax=unclassified Microbacterium TaxID=2609290 RepID=UPI0012FB9CAB|nr:hypothetical protein [Microbacterium sp. MAH-37]MVQ42831.1 hypothetical protein [Microbacterium sp. MAH-37]
MTRKHYPTWLRRRRHDAADGDTLAALAAALSAQDHGATRGLLRADVVVIIDSGGHLPTPSSPVIGRPDAASELLALMAPDTDFADASVNGIPGLTLIREQRVVGVLTAEGRSGLLSSVWVVCNPEKLHRWNR